MPLPGLSGYLALYIQQALQNDATIRSLTGGNPSVDPRVYHYYEADAETPTDYPAYLSWAELSKSREYGGMTQPVISIRIYAYDLDLCHQIEARVEQLFEGITHPSVPNVGRVGTSITQGQDLFDQTNKFRGREMHIQFGVLTATR